MSTRSSAAQKVAHSTPAGASVAHLTIPRSVVTDRGTWSMGLFIGTEATLFVCLFFSYYYLGHLAEVWPPEPPEWPLAVVMLGILASSSLVLGWGEACVRSGQNMAARLAIAGTILLGVSFLGVQTLEYRRHLLKLQPTTNAYGSLFYTITGFHAAHVVLGLLMLLFVLGLPELGESSRPPHRPLHNAALYWHFVDVVWIVIVLLLYVLPNVGR